MGEERWEGERAAAINRMYSLRQNAEGLVNILKYADNLLEYGHFAGGEADTYNFLGISACWHRL
jgi:hypothetical protein